MYNILIADMIKGFPNVVEVAREGIPTDRLAYNLACLWAWNFAGVHTNGREPNPFVADGPTVFLRWD